MPTRTPRRGPGPSRQPPPRVGAPAEQSSSQVIEPTFRRRIGVPRGPMRLRQYRRPNFYPVVIPDTIIPDVDAGGVRIDLYEPDGVTKVTAGTFLALMATYAERVNELGAFSFDIPLEHPMAGECRPGRIAQIRVGGEGFVFQGKIERSEDQPGDTSIRKLSGRGVDAELAALTTRFGLSFSEADAELDVVNALLAGSSWVAGSVEGFPLTTYFQRVVGASRYQGILRMAETFGFLTRQDTTTRTLDFATMGNDCGLRFRNIEGPISPNLRENTSLIVLGGIVQTADITDVVNRVIAVGQEAGITGDQLTLEHATVDDGSAYEVQSAADYSGPDFYYIEDAASVAEYGLSEAVITARNIVEASVSPAQKERASNALWGVAKTYIERHKDPLKSYAIQPVGLKHKRSGAFTFRVGDRCRAQWKGWTKDRNQAKRRYLDIEIEPYIMGYSRTVRADGPDNWQLDISTAPREVPSETQVLVDLYQQFQAAISTPRAVFTWGGVPPVGALTEDGLKLSVGDALVDIDQSNAVQFTSSDFQDTYSRMFGYKDTTIETGQLRDVAAAAFNDAFLLDVIYGDEDYSPLDGTVFEILAKMDGTRFASNSLLKDFQVNSSSVGGLKRVATSPERWAWVASNNGTLQEVSGAMKVQGSGYLVMPAAATGIDPANAGVAWTNGAYSQVIAATSEADYIIGIHWAFESFAGGANIEFEIDIATGAAASEVVIATVAGEFRDNQFTFETYHFAFPIAVATATRVAVRCRSGSTTLEPKDIRLAYVKQSDLVQL